MSDIIKEFHIKAKKSFGQNFLINNSVLETIA
jgi:16S rRNA A1518/A1519 N6-dimethyltransferase RsmA/KsgA/DIM1 with predicted DNA glycosylase/AP lyase activity